MSTRAYAVSLTIPDNEAFTALEALGRLGLPVARVVRADIWLLETDDGIADDQAAPGADDQADASGGRAAAGGRLTATIASIETIYNPNKHRLTERASAEPDPGEVWIAPRDEAPATRVAGRAIPGVRTIRRRTAWRLLDQSGRDVPPAVLDRAVETFLCNPASQAAIRK